MDWIFEAGWKTRNHTRATTIPDTLNGDLRTTVN